MLFLNYYFCQSQKLDLLAKNYLCSNRIVRYCRDELLKAFIFILLKYVTGEKITTRKNRAHNAYLKYVLDRKGSYDLKLTQERSDVYILIRYSQFMPNFLAMFFYRPMRNIQKIRNIFAC